MEKRITFLHLTDSHLAGTGVPFRRDDLKTDVPGIAAGTREASLELLLARLAERLAQDRQILDGVLFSGDAQHRNAPGGHERVIDLLLNHLGPLGVTTNRIVSVPGNHDVPQGSPPSSKERYSDFVRVWRDRGCVVPWLDGLDTSPPINSGDLHRLVAEDRSWAVFPINTSNWSHVTSVLPTPLRDVWDVIPERIASGDTDLAEKLRSQLQALARYDMARVSDQQLEVLRGIVASTPRPDYGRQVRIAVMHHHLRSPSLREELKPFADISNLEQVRAFLSGSNIGVLVHGHKHERATYFDHIYTPDGLDMHRLLVVSGATFESGREGEAARLITMTGIPHTPEITIEPIPLPRAGAESTRLATTTRRLWVTNVRAGDAVVVAPGAPVVVEGQDLDEVYARACAIAKTDARKGTLAVHLDLKNDEGEALPLPQAYPAPNDISGEERQIWFRELVQWWQLDRSQLERRIPYLHGSRLRRYGGKVDQIQRIVSLLRTKPSTRAVAVLVDPFRDFTPDGAAEEFASFCLVEFRRRDDSAGSIFVDAIAFYRAQEFARWWPVNIAELRLLQREICQALGFRPGPITTLAADARTISVSPTQVSMPIVDRWLDQAPERLPLLVDALLHRVQIEGRHAQAIRDWRRSLIDLRLVISAFNPDGIPVAIEGLHRLSVYLDATVPANDRELKDFAQHLGALADLNEMFERSARERADFDRWSPVASILLEKLEQITEDRLPGTASSEG
jgi:hypothetical protein